MQKKLFTEDTIKEELEQLHRLFAGNVMPDTYMGDGTHTDPDQLPDVDTNKLKPEDFSMGSNLLERINRVREELKTTVIPASPAKRAEIAHVICSL